MWGFVKDELEALDIRNKQDTSADVLRTVAAAPSQQSEIASLREEISALMEMILLGSIIKSKIDFETASRYA